MNASASGGILDLQEQIARIDRAQAETRRFAAEQTALSAEADKLRRGRDLAPVQIVLTAMAAGAALFGAGAVFWKVAGGGQVLSSLGVP